MSSPSVLKLLGSGRLAVSLALLAASPTLAQQRGTKRVKIEPYTGPAVFLAEPEEAPDPRFVENRVSKETYEDGTVRVERSVSRYSDDSFVSEGPYSEYYQSGQLFVEGTYRNGAPNGEWTYYHPSGEIAKRVTFKAGQPEGVVESRRPDGTLIARREYLGGKRHGEWKNYAENGEQLRLESSYKAGVPDGVWKTWFPNGQLRRDMTFKEGRRDGVTKEWYESGAKRAEVSFSAGLRDGPSIRWTADGKKTEQVFRGGKLVD